MNIPLGTSCVRISFGDHSCPFRPLHLPDRDPGRLRASNAPLLASVGGQVALPLGSTGCGSGMSTQPFVEEGITA